MLLHAPEILVLTGRLMRQVSLGYGSYCCREHTETLFWERMTISGNLQRLGTSMRMHRQQSATILTTDPLLSDVSQWGRIGPGTQLCIAHPDLFSPIEVSR